MVKQDNTLDDEAKALKTQLDSVTDQLQKNIAQEVIDKYEEGTGQNVDLYKTSELRPLPFSKTVTLFDVYETDEENFVPYVSPLATVGTIETSSSDTTDTEAGAIDDSIGLTDGLTGGTDTSNESNDTGLGSIISSGLSGLGGAL